MVWNQIGALAEVRISKKKLENHTVPYSVPFSVFEAYSFSYSFDEFVTRNQLFSQL